MVFLDCLGHVIPIQIPWSTWMGWVTPNIGLNHLLSWNYLGFSRIMSALGSPHPMIFGAPKVWNKQSFANWRNFLHGRSPITWSLSSFFFHSCKVWCNKRILTSQVDGDCENPYFDACNSFTWFDACFQLHTHVRILFHLVIQHQKSRFQNYMHSSASWSGIPFCESHNFGLEYFFTWYKRTLRITREQSTIIREERIQGID